HLNSKANAMTGIVSHNLALADPEPQHNCDFQYFPRMNNVKCRIGLLLHVLNRLHPDDKAQLVTFVIAGDLPTTRSRYVDTYQHGGRRAINHRIRRLHREQRWSTPVEPSASDF